MPSADETKSSKKRARSEELLETLAQIQQTQQYQTALLTSLLSQHPTLPFARPCSLEDSLMSLVASFEEEVVERPMKIGDYSSDYSRDEYSTNGMNEEYNFHPESYLNWF